MRTQEEQFFELPVEQLDHAQYNPQGNQLSVCSWVAEGAEAFTGT